MVTHIAQCGFGLLNCIRYIFQTDHNIFLYLVHWVTCSIASKPPPQSSLLLKVRCILAKLLLFQNAITVIIDVIYYIRYMSNCVKCNMKVKDLKVPQRIVFRCRGKICK